MPAVIGVGPGTARGNGRARSGRRAARRMRMGGGCALHGREALVVHAALDAAAVVLWRRVALVERCFANARYDASGMAAALAALLSGDRAWR